MINCPSCNISFSPSYEFCPRCKTFATPREPRHRYLKENAEWRISAGEPAEEVRELLLDAGFSESDADRIVGRANSALRAETRGNGVWRFVVGLLMLGLGGLFVVVLMSGSVGGKGIGLGLGILLGGGGLAALSGLYTLISGRESRVVGKIVDRVQNPGRSGR
ncbi:MAG: hypothetical protein AAFU85_24490 [Planctomycetota bacterium]